MKWAQILLMVIAMPATVCAQRAGFPSTAPMPATPLTTAQVPANQPSTNMVPLRPTGPSTYSPSPTYPAQQPYAAQPYPAQPYQAQPYGASNGAAPVYPPNGGGYQPTYPSSSLGVPSLNQSFDPYAKQNAGPSLFPSGPTGSGNASILPGMFGSGTVMGQPSSYSGFGPNTQVLPPPDVSYPSTIYPNQTPPALFPNGFMMGNSGVLRSNSGAYADAMGMPEAFRLIQGPRLRQTYVSGGEGADEVGIDDTETSVAVVFPSFLWSTQPLYILPSFGLHLFDGPAGPPSDLPSKVYDAFIAAGWQSDPNQILGAELGLAIGAFTDFDTFNDDSIRYMGSALGKLRITPTATLKAGVMYLDRNEVKLIPAGGILWQPGPYTRFDITFPNPKLSRYLSTIGTQDLWGYVSGEFGGGSWTITRTNGLEDSIDINDIRLIVGLEWGLSDYIRSGRRTGFIEGGWVTERRLRYRLSPADDVDLDDAFMVRAGFGY